MVQTEVQRKLKIVDYHHAITNSDNGVVMLYPHDQGQEAQNLAGKSGLSRRFIENMQPYCDDRGVEFMHIYIIGEPPFPHKDPTRKEFHKRPRRFYGPGAGTVF